MRPVEESTRTTRVPLVLRATAEFVVIVVGVLVAFALEDWSNDRADRATELQYLTSLVADVRGDSAVWTNLHSVQLARRRSILEEIIPIAQGDVPVPEDTVSFLRTVSDSHITQFMSATGPTYEELQSTGSLRLIESAALRSAIVGFYQAKRSAQQRSETLSPDLKDLVEAAVPAALGRSALFLGGSPGGEELVGPVFSIPAALTIVLTPEFANAAKRNLNYVALMSYTIDDLLVEARQLIPLLDTEIERLR